MATSPICPDDFQKANFGSSTCDLLTQLLLTNDKLLQFFSWMFDPETCRLSEDFVAEFQGTLQPIGSVIWSPVVLTSPNIDVKEWVEANGQLVLKTDYPKLYELYGNKFGEDVANNKFGVPDLRGRMLQGYGKRTANKPPDVPPEDPVDPETVPGTIEYLLAGVAGSNGLGGADEVVLTDVQSGIGESHQHGIGGINFFQNTSPGGTDKNKFGAAVNKEDDEDNPGRVIPTGYDVEDYTGINGTPIGNDSTLPSDYHTYDKVHVLTSEPIKELTEDIPVEPHPNLPPFCVGIYYIRASHRIRDEVVPVQ